MMHLEGSSSMSTMRRGAEPREGALPPALRGLPTRREAEEALGMPTGATGAASTTTKPSKPRSWMSSEASCADRRTTPLAPLATANKGGSGSARDSKLSACCVTSTAPPLASAAPASASASAAPASACASASACAATAASADAWQLPRPSDLERNSGYAGSAASSLAPSSSASTAAAAAADVVVATSSMQDPARPANLSPRSCACTCADAVASDGKPEAATGSWSAVAVATSALAFLRNACCNALIDSCTAVEDSVPPLGAPSVRGWASLAVGCAPTSSAARSKAVPRTRSSAAATGTAESWGVGVTTCDDDCAMLSNAEAASG
mmetsp:Transcript_92204/g.269799  ORF Transcript_92204/g.269799 Transcript_92204/m.269799 type:complete len:324 (-) Transcript_92204:577-1548(-)